MENSKKIENPLNSNERHDNLIIILFAYYLTSIPIALVISGLCYPLLKDLSYVLFLILSIFFLLLTFLVQKLNNNARIVLSLITISLLLGSLIFPFLIPIQNNNILGPLSIINRSLSIGDYVFYVFGVDGSFLIFGSFMVYVLYFDKRTVNLFK